MYYELLVPGRLGYPVKRFLEPGIYVIPYDKDRIYETDDIEIKHMNGLIQFCQRVWKEDDAGVEYVKNRYDNCASGVDLEEFIWIKLSAIPLI
jgi:hypothetical protein